MQIRFKNAMLTSQLDSGQRYNPSRWKKEWEKQDAVILKNEHAGIPAAAFSHRDPQTDIQYFGVVTDKDALPLQAFTTFTLAGPSQLNSGQKQDPILDKQSLKIAQLSFDMRKALNEMAYLKATQMEPCVE